MHTHFERLMLGAAAGETERSDPRQAAGSPPPPLYRGPLLSPDTPDPVVSHDVAMARRAESAA